MSDIPFGFNPGPEQDPEGADQGSERGKSPEKPGKPENGPGGRSGGGPSPGDPFAGLLGGLGGGPGGVDLGAALQRLGQLMSAASTQSGAVNWELARETARQVVARAGDRSVTTGDREPVLEAMRLADLWLDDVCAFPSSAASAAAWSRAEWVESTLPAWKELVEPVAAKAVESMGSLLTGEGGPLGEGGQLGALGLPAEQLHAMAQMMGPLQQMLRGVGAMMFGAQLGQALGTLATEVVSSTDVGLPLAPDGRSALLPANVTAFGEGLGVPADQIRLYLALREAAHQRLFAHAPWLRAHLTDAIAAYARGMTVDPSRLQEAMGSIDPMNPESVQQALTGGLFEPEDTPAQKAALQRLETALALVEGWVDEVVDAAAGPHLPAAGPLRETVRRRRASGGPAEQTFASLVGLELRPRRLREAAAVWRAVLAERGQAGREAVWAHPDLLPGPEDLDDPAAFAAAASVPLDLSGLEDTTPPPEPGCEPPPDGGASEPPR